MGSGSGQDEEFPCRGRRDGDPQKSSKISKHAKTKIIPRKKDWELLSTSYCTVFRCATFLFSLVFRQKIGFRTREHV